MAFAIFIVHADLDSFDLLSVCYYTIVSTGDRFRCAGEYPKLQTRLSGDKDIGTDLGGVCSSLSPLDCTVRA
jgi:hypothetical protein